MKLDLLPATLLFCDLLRSHSQVLWKVMKSCISDYDCTFIGPGKSRYVYAYFPYRQPVWHYGIVLEKSEASHKGVEP